jgi:hypothetical protein
MSQPPRLAAILAADVVGYSRLMGADEEGTYERIQAHLRELVEPKIKDILDHIQVHMIRLGGELYRRYIILNVAI